MTPRRSDLAALGAYAALTLALGYLSLESSLTTPAWTLAALFLAGIGTILVSRRHPLAAFIAALALLPLSFAGGSGAEVLLVVGALYRSGVVAPPRRAWIAFAAAAASGALAALVLSIRVRLGPRCSAWRREWTSTPGPSTGSASPRSWSRSR